jgi:cell division protein FtsB
MKYSFVKPKKKTLVSIETKIWVLIIVLNMGVLFGFYSFVKLEHSIVTDDINQYNKMSKELTAKTDRLNKNIEKVKQEKRFTEEIYSSNIVIKDSIQNLFELIPSQVTLSSVFVYNEELIIEGVTPSKEIYKFLLEVPFTSIFEDTTVQFNQRPDGLFHFRSINTFEKENQ